MLRRAFLSALIAATLGAAALPSSAWAAAAAHEEKKKGGGETYVQIPTLTATIQRADGARGVMTVGVGVDVPDAGLRKRAQESIPLLRDAFLREMLTYVPSIGPGGFPNPDTISAMLQRATDRTLNRPGAKLLLGSILVN